MTRKKKTLQTSRNDHMQSAEVLNSFRPFRSNTSRKKQRGRRRKPKVLPQRSGNGDEGANSILAPNSNYEPLVQPTSHHYPDPRYSPDATHRPTYDDEDVDYFRYYEVPCQPDSHHHWEPSVSNSRAPSNFRKEQGGYNESQRSRFPHSEHHYPSDSFHCLAYDTESTNYLRYHEPPHSDSLLHQNVIYSPSNDNAQDSMRTSVGVGFAHLSIHVKNPTCRNQLAGVQCDGDTCLTVPKGMDIRISVDQGWNHNAGENDFLENDKENAPQSRPQSGLSLQEKDLKDFRSIGKGCVADGSNSKFERFNPYKRPNLSATKKNVQEEEQERWLP